MAESAGRAARVQEYDCTVTEIIRETSDAATLVLESTSPLPPYKAGQFCTIDVHQFPALTQFTRYLETAKGKREMPRAYSLSSSPHEPRIAFTVKEEQYIEGTTPYPPLLSPFLVRCAFAGMAVRISGFHGPYVLPEDIEQRTGRLVHLVAGSGAVPNFSILKDSLQRGKRVRHTFLYSNKTAEDICFLGQLKDLEARHSDRLRVVHFLTRQPPPQNFDSVARAGRIRVEDIRELVPDWESAYFYACGPAITSWERRRALQSRVPAAPRFLETVLGHLNELGVPPSRVKREAYG